MTPSTPNNNCDSFGELITGYIDGELTQGDRQRVELHIESCERCRKTCGELTRQRDDVAGLSFGQIEPNEWSDILNTLPVKASRRFGWALYIGGAVLLLAFGAYQFILDDSEDPIVKIGFGALYLGLVLLFLSVLRQRMIASKTDKYKDVQL
jgi:predicted anti-sigma-YlaC factor YlaD